MTSAMLSLPSLGSIGSRLSEIFPEGTANRSFVIREISTKTIFVMLYTGAVEGSEVWIRPDQVTKMTDAQAKKADQAARQRWHLESLAPGKMKAVRGRWYASNTRESIRDETLRMGLVYLGAVAERENVPTTSSKPRYALKADFAALFDTRLSRQLLQKAVAKWQELHLGSLALARIRLRKRGAAAAAGGTHVLVTFPNNESRQMSPGPSSILTKAVIEVFAKRFFSEAAVVFVSESGSKVVAEDEHFASSIGLRIESDKNLPDIILLDIGLPQPLLVFVEVVVTDGAIGPARYEALLGIATRAGIPKERVRFVSAFEDRGSSTFRRLSGELAWGSLAWVASEPDKLILFMDKLVQLHQLP
jgi:hypothetical protein